VGLAQNCITGKSSYNQSWTNKC